MRWQDRGYGQLGKRGIFALTLSCLLFVTGCVADPPPPVQQTNSVPPEPAEPSGQVLYVATDSIGIGFNPHLAADQSAVTTAVAAMTLPSSFRPVTEGDRVVWTMDSALLTSADVTGTAPFTVTYRIHEDAQWSDGLPITAEDFIYLWQQMGRQPNVTAPAGYRMITDVRSGAGGKEVTATFAAPYPAWRELFNDLLPSHVLKGAPGGFQSGMDSGFPASGGPFTISGIDHSRDEVRLIRNDRFWLTPALLDRMTLRRAGTTSQLSDSMRSGDTRVAAVSGGPALAANLGSIGGVQTGNVAQSRTLGVTVNTRTEAMSNIDLRRAVLASIDTRLVTFAGADDTEVLPAENSVYAPSDPGYYPVPRPAVTPEQIEQWLTSAGYQRGPVEPAPTPAQSTPGATTTTTTTETPPSGDEGASGSESNSVPPLPAGTREVEEGDDGDALVVRVASVTGDPRTGAAAANIVDQLRRTGIRAETVTLSTAELYSSALTGRRVDIVVGWSRAGESPATALASNTECLSTETSETPSTSVTPTAEVPQSGVPESQIGVPESQTGESSSPPSSQAPDAERSEPRYTSNVSGLCDAELQGLATRAISEDDPTENLRTAQRLLDERSVYLPIYQDVLTTAASPLVTGAAVTGPVQTGIFGGSAAWQQQTGN
ncbi:ABC-type transport system substrate-binding protein [Williamsia limnetica]|uniref:ABC-type transport system substrate-binding protein n=1 Tax=Williamsia limnetica TaxID=882452 RepID=A0A318REK5_WILLI|nr:ABC transporter family substrate-binding protein [Williamsia limnetica]PYE13748.1 ABC-type transport system substrate-binding protein [Williamsia limnetica]